MQNLQILYTLFLYKLTYTRLSHALLRISFAAEKSNNDIMLSRVLEVSAEVALIIVVISGHFQDAGFVCLLSRNQMTVETACCILFIPNHLW